jgi:tetratricopeptide (TPR) repeat protein
VLPLRHALALAVLVLVAGGLWDAQATGFRLPVLYDRLGFSLEKYGLVGYSAFFRLAAARMMAEAASASAGSNPDAARSAANVAADAYRRAAEILAAQGASDEAPAALRSALRVAPWRSDCRARLLGMQVQAGDRLAARALTDLAYRGDDAYAQLALAKLYLRDNRPEDAGACMARALKTIPESHDLHLTYAEYLMSYGVRSDAARHAKDALRDARTISEKLQAADLVRTSDEQAPTRFDILWEYFLSEYLPTVLAMIAYLLVLLSPSLSRRLRRGAQRLSAWHAGLSPE